MLLVKFTSIYWWKPWFIKPNTKTLHFYNRNKYETWLQSHGIIWALTRTHICTTSNPSCNWRMCPTKKCKAGSAYDVRQIFASCCFQSSSHFTYKEWNYFLQTTTYIIIITREPRCYHTECFQGAKVLHIR